MREKRRKEQNHERYSNTQVVEKSGSESEAEPEPGGTHRASQEVLEGRRIIRASRKRISAGARKMTPSSSSYAPAPAAASNPFAFTTLVRPANTTTVKPSLFAFNSAGGIDDNDKPPSQSSQPNPFANVAFTSNSTTTTTGDATSTSVVHNPSLAPPKVSFASLPTTQSGHIPPAVSSNISTTPSNSTVASRPTSNTARKEMRDLNIALWQLIVDHWEGGHYTDDYSSFMREYLAHAEEILQQEEEDRDDEDDDGPNEKIGPPPNQLLSTPSFSFGATPSAPPVVGPSYSAPSFSFGTTSSAPPVAGPSSSAPSFSFGATSAAPSTSHSNTASNGNEEEEDDPTANPDDGQVEFVEQKINLEEDILYEVRASSFKSVDGAWKKFTTGTLRVYGHKVTGKHRMVIRNEIGKELFNVAVAKGMKFQKIKNNVAFGAVEDAEKGRESFMVKVKPEFVDELHCLLENLVKG